MQWRIDSQPVTCVLPLCRLDELPDGESRGFDPFGAGRDSMFVVRKKATLFAYVNACPHVHASPLAWRKDRYLNAAKDHIVCSGHGAEFDIETGACVLGPCIGENLQSIPHRISDDGVVHIGPDFSNLQPLETNP